MASCDPCLGLGGYRRPKHYKCQLNGCSCSCSRNHFREPTERVFVTELNTESGSLRSVIPSVKPTTPPKLRKRHQKPVLRKRSFARSDLKKLTIQDVPLSVRTRVGRYMTEEQKEWIPVLRADNWKVTEIAEAIGFGHVAIVQALNRDKNPVA